MDVRKKLVELLEPHMSGLACEYESGSCELTSCRSCNAKNIADNLITNGVTVQEWISVKDRLPENDQLALCFMKDKSFGTFRVFQWNYIDWQWNDGNEWFDEKDVTHWIPIPQPPKGE